MAFEALFLAVEYARRSSTSALPDAPVVDDRPRWPVAALLTFLRRRRGLPPADAGKGPAAGVPGGPAVAVGRAPGSESQAHARRP